MTSTNFESLLPLPFSPTVLWIVFAIFTALVLIMSIILLYHWSKYGFNGFYIGFASTLYLVGATILFSSTLISFFAYIQSL